MALRSRRVRHQIKAEINIVPLLDVLLVLLLIFMATAPILTQSVEVNLPEATQSKTVSGEETPPVILEVSGPGQYALVIGQARQEQLPEEQVIQQVQAQMQQHPAVRFLVGGEKTVPYDDIIRALNLLHQAGVKSVGLMTQPL